MPIAAAEVLGKPDPPRRWMLCLSLAQGLVLLWLWRAVDAEWWPSQTPGINYPLWALAIVGPGMLLFCLDAGNRMRTLAIAGAFAVLVALLAAYLGWLASPFGEFPVDLVIASGVLSLLVACFLALFFLQSWGASLALYGRHDDALILFDLGADGRNDYLFIRAGWDRVAAAHIHLGDDGAWQAAVLAPRERLPHGTNLQAMLRNGGLGRAERTVQDFKVGDLVLSHRHDYEKGRSDRWVVFRERED